MKRIAILTHTAYPLEPRCRRMGESLVAAGYAVDVFCLRGEDELTEEPVNGVRVVRLPVRHHQGAGAAAYLQEYARFFWLAGRALWRQHRKTPYGLVQVHNPPDALVFATLPLKLRGVPVLLDLRELMPELFMSRFALARTSLIVRLLTLAERAACAYADGVVVLHERHRRIMTGRGVAAAKLTEVMNCPDERIFAPHLARRGSAGRQPGARFVVVNHGAMLQRYGVDLLVRAAALVRPQIPRLQVDLYGSGDYLPALRALAEELGVADIVTFHGYRPLEEMPPALAAADVGVAPMRRDIFTDCGLPTKLLEYITLRVPAIASRTATTTDYFDERSVLLFEPDDAGDLADKLLAVYRDPAAADARAAEALHFTENHNWRRESASYIATVARLAH